MHCPQHLTVVAGGVTERVDAGYDGEGLRFQVPEVHRCIREGLVESPVLPHDESLAIARTLDAIRAQLGHALPRRGLGRHAVSTTLPNLAPAAKRS